MPILFEESFDGPAGSLPNPTLFKPDNGSHGFGQNQIQTHQDENGRLDGQGSLKIIAKVDAQSKWTSARYWSRGLWAWKDGLLEWRVKCPVGEGLGVEIFNLRADWSPDPTSPNRWPLSGEITHELKGVAPKFIYGTLISANDQGAKFNKLSAHFMADPGSIAEWNQVAFLKKAGRLEWILNDKAYKIETREGFGGTWPFDAPYMPVISLAVGGDAMGPLGASTPPEAVALFDYLRHYSESVVIPAPGPIPPPPPVEHFYVRPLEPVDDEGTYRLDIPKDGLYRAWGLCFAPTTAANSFRTSMDDAEYETWDIRPVGQGDVWDLINSPVSDPRLYQLTQGRHVFKVIRREALTRLKDLVFTNDPAWHPSTPPPPLPSDPSNTLKVKLVNSAGLNSDEAQVLERIIRQAQ